jgi:hypothetical protein
MRQLGSRLALLLSGLLGLATLPVPAWAQTFNVGERVVIGSTGDTGTVLQTGQATAEGGIMVKVLLDKPTGPTVADREVWYNSRSSKVTPEPKSATPGQPAAPPPAPAPSTANAKEPLKVGDRVKIGSLDVTGTVVEIGGVLGNGSVMMRVEIDKNASKFGGRSSWYDTLSSKITPAGN